MKELDEFLPKAINLKNTIEKEIIKLDKLYEKINLEVSKSFEIKHKKLIKEEKDLKEKLKNEIIKKKKELENFLSESNKVINKNKQINIDIKTLSDKDKIREINIIKVLSYISKMNKNKEDIIFLLNELMKNINVSFNEDEVQIIYKEYLFNGEQIQKDLRPILYMPDNKRYFNDVKVSNILKTENNSQNYNIYNKKNFSKLLNMNSLFENKDISLQKNYENMLIKEKNKYKGIYIHECEDESMEVFILEIFLDKMEQLPNSENILICNDETSPEEIQVFLYRAILCYYNTLFAVEINDSFSENQQNIMYSYIEKLLASKYEKYKEFLKENIEKKGTKEHLDSCLLFVYNLKNKFNISFINELRKYEIKELGTYKKIKLFMKNDDEEIENNLNNNKSNITLEIPKLIYKNIKVITSDICGLGKSYKIKYMIKNNNKLYYYFPLGGILTKKTIFYKIFSLLEKIKIENGENYQNISIHLDLFESKDISIINEFLFSLLITKTYTYKDKIIYIPKDIEIYIEIANCFYNYLSKFAILDIFVRENNTLENLEKLELPQEIINFFNRTLEFDSNKKIEEFIKKNIGIEKYSYRHVQIFIKLFLSQFNQFTTKLKFMAQNKDFTKETIEEFSKSTQYFTMGRFSKLLLNQNFGKTIECVDILSEIYDYDLRNDKFDIPLYFIIKTKGISEKLYFSESIKYKEEKNFLKEFKSILNLQNDVEKDNEDKKSLLSILNYKTDNYVIINDNFKKMILILYRIKANIPVIIIGETGCGKTDLIIKLNQLLNNGEKLIKIIKIYPGITYKYICAKMKEINEEARKKKDEIWLFFDEMNTCLSLLSLLTEIFMNRTFNGEIINKNIRLIGACNPYRKRKNSTERFGLIRDDDYRELVYFVHPLPQSLLYYAFNFGFMGLEDEKDYIYFIIKKLFTKEEKNLHEVTRDAIFQCHQFLREIYDPSIVSLREISRFTKIVEFFLNYFSIKDEYLNKYYNDKESKKKLYKIKSIICSIYLCYVMRLNDYNKRYHFNNFLREILLKLVNIEEADKNTNDEEYEDRSLFDEIKFKLLKIDLREEPFNDFSDFIKIEEAFLLDQIKLNKGIAKNSLLKEIVFLSFCSIITKIPSIIIGRPGSGKSLSIQLISKTMRGKFSENKFFQKFQPFILTYFQGAESTNSEELEKLFTMAENKLQFFYEKENKIEELPISMILFDKLDLSEKSESNPLNLLHYKLENDCKNEGISFIGFSNYSLGPSEINRVLALSVPELEDRLDEIISTSNFIVESISEDLKDNKIFRILPRAYFEYKKYLNFIKEFVVLKQFNSENKQPNIDLMSKEFGEIKIEKEYKNLLKKEKKIKLDFHGLYDFYYLIKGIAIEIGKLSNYDENEVVPIVEKYIERNFGGIDNEIDIDLNLKLSDIESKINTITEILKELMPTKRGKKENKKIRDKKEKENEKIKVSSLFLFKKIYNKACEMENKYQYKISDINVNRYDINRSINDNINNINNRYLLLGIKPSLSSLIYQNIQIQNPNKIIKVYEGSPFVDDYNKEYGLKIINEIQEDIKSEKLIILQNLNQIHPFLYDLYNMNYIIKNDKKYVKINLDSFTEKLIPVNDLFRIIILMDKKKINDYDISFLNRFEKIKIYFENLLDDEQKKLTKIIIEEINFKYHINNMSICYSLKDLLINCKKEDIAGLIYYLSIEIKKNNKKLDENIIKEKVYNKICNILPQDIICFLPDYHIIKRKYYDNKKYYNFNDYISDEENKKYKISIIYTFSSITSIINGANNEMKFMISEIKTENQLKNVIEKIKNQNKNKIDKNYNILIQFDVFNSNKIQYISNFINNYYNEDRYNYIFIIYIKRNFDPKNTNRIYYLFDINQNINQLFIDNLNGANVRLKDLLETNIKDIIINDNDQLINLNIEFKKSLNNFVYKELNEKRNNINIIDNQNCLINDDNYIYEIQKYMDNEKDFKNELIKKAKKLIYTDEELEGDCQNLVIKKLKNEYIDKNTIDIISCIIDYAKEQIFSKYLIHIFRVLEDNNFLTTLLEIKKNNKSVFDESIIEKLKKIHVEEITMDNKIYKPKFLYNFKIPELYKFYKDLSNYIKKNISEDYLNNENKLKEYLISNNEKVKNDFHEKEENLVSLVYNEIKKDKIIFDIINNISPDLIFKDYINFYLDKYSDIKDELNNELIESLLNFRFNDEKMQIINNNPKDHIKNMLIKIIWIESNNDYILNILKKNNHKFK